MKNVTMDTMNCTLAARSQRDRSLTDRDDDWLNYKYGRIPMTTAENGCHGNSFHGNHEQQNHSYLPRHLASQGFDFWTKSPRGPVFENAESPLSLHESENGTRHLKPSSGDALDGRRNVSGQSRSGQSRTGQSRTGQSRSDQSRSGQSRTGQSRSGQSRRRTKSTGHTDVINIDSQWGQTITANEEEVVVIFNKLQDGRSCDDSEGTDSQFNEYRRQKGGNLIQNTTPLCETKLGNNMKGNVSNIHSENVNKAAPPFLRHSTMPEICIQQKKTEEQELHSTFDQEDPKKYLRTPNSPQKISRRSMSDLGFRKKSPGLGRSNSRTMALLQNPIFRRSLANTLQLDASRTDFDDEVCEKLTVKVEESFDQSFNVSESGQPSSSRDMRLCCSTSDLGFLRDLRSQMEPGDSELSGEKLNRSISPPTKDHDSSLEESGISLNLTKTSPRSSITSKDVSAFRVPTFGEFKLLRGKKKSQSTTNIANIVPTIIEEESNNETGESNSNMRHNDRGTSVLQRMSENSSLDDVLYPDGSPKPMPRRKKKTHSQRSETCDNGVIRHRSQSMGQIAPQEGQRSYGRRHEVVVNTDILHKSLSKSTNNVVPQKGQNSKSAAQTESSCDENSSQTESVIRTRRHKAKHRRNIINRCQSENLLKKSGSDRRETPVLSDYASDSNAEHSDDLEDVFLRPISHKRTEEVRASDVSFILADSMSESSLLKHVPLTDSGCLVERRSCEFDVSCDTSSVKDDTTMFRSTSDVSEMVAEGLRTKMSRERRSKQYSSDPLNCRKHQGGVYKPGLSPHHLERQDSKEDILNFLEGNSGEANSSSTTSHGTRSQGERSERAKKYAERRRRLMAKPPSGRKKVSSSAELDTSDVMDVTGDSLEKITQDQIGICGSCGELLCHSPGHMICEKCEQKRRERREAILEIIDTESNYGNDLNIINRHFYEPLKTTGFLTPEQLQTIFINLKELLAVNAHFTSQLTKALNTATKPADQWLDTVRIGQLFLESSNMLLAYESYCINQSAAPILLDQLLEEKDLLRIFLEVAQREKSVLRKMDLKAFLMLPVQRIMKYPLLLSRLHQITPLSHPDYSNIAQAQRKIEFILEVINSKTKGSVGTKLKRRLSSARRSQEFDSSVFDNIEMHRVALEALGWERSGTSFRKTSRLACVSIIDHMSLRRCKTLKYTQVYGVLVTLTKPSKPSTVSSQLSLADAALVLVKDKGGKQILFREPFLLSHCVLCRDPYNSDVFQLHEANKDSFIFKCESGDDFTEWYRQLHLVVAELSRWRHRRHGLANIMLFT